MNNYSISFFSNIYITSEFLLQYFPFCLQALMNLVVFGSDRMGNSRRLNSSRVHIWELNEKYSCGDKWFVYQKYFAQKEDYPCSKVSRLAVIRKYEHLHTVDGRTIS